MGSSSMENPKTWVPYMINTKDCSQGFCSLYCPQWCYMIFPPPPPFEFPNEHKDSKFSPLIVAVIGILASAFLLVSYYAIISKYCKNREEDRNHPNDESQGNQDSPSSSNDLSQSQAAANNGLDEAMIKSITVFKFKKQKGSFNESTESCSVCLSEFQENESLRLLPKCSHAFHKMCIDTWLKSHSNCPLCRANIVFANSLSPSAIELTTLQESSSQSTTPVIFNVAVEEEDIEMGIHDVNPDNPAEIRSNLYKSNEGEPIRRSLSMNDCVSHVHLSIADVLHINQDEEAQMVEDQWPNWDGSETSKRRVVANGVANCDAGGAGVRRSVSSGRFVLSNGVNGRNTSSIPF